MPNIDDQVRPSATKCDQPRDSSTELYAVPISSFPYRTPKAPKAGLEYRLGCLGITRRGLLYKDGWLSISSRARGRGHSRHPLVSDCAFILENGSSSLAMGRRSLVHQTGCFRTIATDYQLGPDYPPQ